MIWDYRGEVLKQNPGSTFLVGLDPEGTGKFDRCYVSFAACKDGFKELRHIIGLNGCHLKGKYGGILLTAVGIDAINNIFPICWAIVKSECYFNLVLLVFL